MMRPLGELVKFRNDLVDRLEQLSLVAHINEVIQQLNLTMTENFDIEAFSAHDKITQAVTDYQKILDQSEFVRNNLKSVIGDIDVKINELALQNNTLDNYFDGENVNGGITFAIDPNVHQLIIDRMSHYIDHRFPGLRLGCRYVGQRQIDDMSIKDYTTSIEYSNILVANDPLYFYDIKEKLIETVTNHFNDIYSRRIRLYTDLSKLPQQQFGFIFSWNLFNFASISIIDEYFHKIFDLLRPGGVVMFSYNNCDIVESAHLADMGYMSFVSKRNLTNLLKQIGYEIIASYDEPNQEPPSIPIVSWMEIRRPGKLETVKIKQVMGVVARK
jgi:hypothetical protein